MNATATAARPYDTARRSLAARMGWEWRRRGPARPDALHLAHGRLDTLLRLADEATARLVACDAAERALPHFTARYPGDQDARAAILAGRQLAGGEIGESARRRGVRRAIGMLDRVEVDTGRLRSPYWCAANAAAWCVGRTARTAARWAITWAAGAEGREGELAALLGTIAALEAALATAPAAGGEAQP